MTFDVEHDLRQALRCLKEIICLETSDRGERVKRVGLSHRNHVVRIGIDSKFTLIKILHQKRVAQLRDIHDSGDVFGEIGRVLQGQAVSVRQYLTARNGGRINVRVLVVDVIGLDLEITRFVLSVINVRIKPDRGAAASAIIQSKPAFNIVGDWKCELRQKGRSPGAQVSRRDGKTEGVVERLIQVRPPKDRNFSDVEGDV